MSRYARAPKERIGWRVITIAAASTPAAVPNQRLPSA
jgi:hypothetical protein